MNNLKKAKEMVADFHREYSSHHPMFTEEDMYNLSWLIAQAEWTKHYGEKAGKLNEFLQERVSDRLGDNVIDVAMDYIRYLEKELNDKSNWRNDE